MFGPDWAIFSVVVAQPSRGLRRFGRTYTYTGTVSIPSIAVEISERSSRFEPMRVQADSLRFRGTFIADLGVTSVSHVSTNGRELGWYRLDD